MKKKPYIYKITIGEYFYFGQSICPLSRSKTHKLQLKSGNHVNKFMQSVFNKSYNDLSFSPVLYCEETELNRYEQWFIDKYYDDPKCMNLSKNSSATFAGRKHSAESRKKMAKSHLGRKASKEARANMSESQKGNKNRLGTKTSKETRKKLSEAQKGNTNKRDKTVYTFFHDDGISIDCTRAELCLTQGLDQGNLWKVFKGERKQHKGWRIKQ